MPRMRILNAVEQYDFDSPPVFNSLQGVLCETPPKVLIA